MSKQPTISTISSGFYSTSALNVNFENIRDQFDNTLSLDGSTPNAMTADLDLNGNSLLNVGNFDVDSFTVNGQVVNNPTSLLDWQGDWATATSYDAYDVVSENGSSYVCLVAHTSDVFVTDLGNNKWATLAEKGESGPGTGDLLAANNLSDVANATTARNNLGAQANDATLTALAGLSTGANKVPYSTGTDTFGQLDFVDEDDMVSDSATALPSQQSVKAYVDAETITKTTGSAPYYGVRAFGEVDSTGSLTWGKNIASATRASTGVYTVTFTTAMSDTNYVVNATAIRSDADNTHQRNYIVRSRSTTSFTIQSTDATNNTLQDQDFLVTVIA